MSQSDDKLVINVDSRADLGKGACRRLRKAGKLPAIVYGLNKPSYPVTVEPRRIENLLRSDAGRNAMITLSLDGGKDTRAVMIRDLQFDPIRDTVTHVDFVRLDLEKEVHVKVPIQLVGVPDGVKNEGGLVDFVQREINVACLPTGIPGHLDVDISELHIGQHVSVEDVEPGEGVKLLDPPDTIIAVVAAPKAEEEPEAVEGEAVEGEVDPDAPADGEAAATAEDDAAKES